MLKLIHAADLHLDAPFASLPPERAAERREEQRELLERLCDAAEGADLLFLAGDVFDSDRPYYETTKALARALGRLSCPVFVAPGNHDFWSARSPWSATAWPDNVHIFKTGVIESVELPDLGCVVHGCAFTAPYRDDSPLASFTAPADGRLHLGILHGDAEGKGRYGSLSAGEIGESGLTYLALGHVHACSGMQKAGGTYWAYPGCPEGRGFDELGDKGALCVTLDGPHVSAEFLPLAKRRYEILTVDVSGTEEPDAALEAALPVGAEQDIYRVLLVGESGVKGMDLARLEALAASRFYSVSLRDNTRVRRDLWARSAEDSLTGLFLRQMRQRREDAETDTDRALVEKAVRFGLAALENGEDCCP